MRKIAALLLAAGLSTRMGTTSYIVLITDNLTTIISANILPSYKEYLHPNSIHDILVCGVDQPRDHTVIRSILDNHIQTRSLVTIPAFQGKGGHPTIFSCKLFEEMNAITDTAFGLKSLIYNQPVNLFEVATKEILIDLNTRSDYEKAYRRNFF